MSILQKTANPISEERQKQFAIIAQDVNMTTKRMVEVMIPIQTLTDISSESMRQMYETLSFISKEVLREMIKAFSAMSIVSLKNLELGLKMPKIDFPIFDMPEIISSSISSLHGLPFEIIDGEIEIGAVDIPQIKEILALPESLEVREIKPILQSRLGIKLLTNGIYLYQRRMLKNLSLKNKAGNLLKLFLLNKPHFVSHKEIQEKLGIEADEEYAYTFSHIFKHLKKIFKNNGYNIEFVCQRRQGYFLENIKPLSN